MKAFATLVASPAGGVASLSVPHRPHWLAGGQVEFAQGTQDGLGGPVTLPYRFRSEAGGVMDLQQTREEERRIKNVLQMLGQGSDTPRSAVSCLLSLTRSSWMW